jgi:hypothetical protein
MKGFQMPIKIKPLFYLLAILLLSSCFRQSPPTQAIDSTDATTARAVKVVIPQPITPDYVPTLKLGLQLSFGEAMNQTSVQTSFGLFSGEYKPNANPAKYEKLELSSVCNGTWRVKNKNPFPLSFTWEIFKGTESGLGVVAANGEAYFYTGLRTGQGKNRARLYVSGKHQRDEDSKDIACTTQPFDFSWSSDSKTLLVLPTTPLVPNAIYTVVLSTQ